MKPNTTIGHYNILRPLGAGGMGEVYLAEDTRLKRQVAVKVLPERLRSSEERLKRFRREAEAAASLKHPNIATIYGLEEIDDQLLITMEHVEGHTLKEAIPEGGMEIEQFFDTFIPLADALAHAHSQGRIHRDLKPANIMITEDGTPKILDFGLARIIDPDAVEAYSDTGLGEDDATQTMKDGVPSLTRGGQLIGTPQYMSPEQAERKDTDARTDIFSFGLVMYEALTGKRAFDGESLESIIGRILEAEPKAVTEIRPITPYTLWTVIRRCIAKKPDRRMQSATELVAELESIQQDIQAGTVLVDASSIPEPYAADVAAVVPEPVPFWQQPAAVGFAAVTLLIGLGVAWVLKPNPVLVEKPVRRFELPIKGLGFSWKISPDGTMVAYSSQDKLWVRDLDQVSARAIADGRTFGIFWSPDSKFVGFTQSDETHRVAAKGGPSLKVTDGSGSSTWLQSGVIIKGSREGGLSTVSSQGGEFQPFMQPDTTAGEVYYRYPHQLPDGESLIYIVGHSDNSRELVVQKGQRRVSLVQSAGGEDLSFPVYASSGHILFERSSDDGDNIWAIPFEPSTQTVWGEPILVAQDASLPSVSVDGTLLYNAGSRWVPTRLALVDRSGAVIDTIGRSQNGIFAPAISPDGRNVAVVAREQNQMDIWVHSIQRGTTTRLTFDDGMDIWPSWHPDNRTVFYASNRTGSVDIYAKRADGTDNIDTLTTTGDASEFYPTVSADGSFLVYMRNGESRDLWYRRMDGLGASLPFLATQHAEVHSAISPDGRYLAYDSDESGRSEIYVRPFPQGESRWQISINGGGSPRWNAYGTELYFAGGNVTDVYSGDVLMSVPVKTSPSFEHGTPMELFKATGVGALTPAGIGFGNNGYDVTADGKRFVVVQEVSGGEAPKLVVVQNWYSEFKDLE